MDKMKEELNTILSLNKKTIQEFGDLGKEIQNSPLFQTKCLINTGLCDNVKNLYLVEKKKSLDTFERYNSEYNLLIKEKNRLQCLIDEVKENSKNLSLELQECEESRNNIKKAYKSQKTNLKDAKKVYDCTFGMEVSVQGFESDIFEATIVFVGKRDFPVKFSVDRASNKILDFDASSFLPEDKLKQLKATYILSNNYQALICKLRNFVMEVD